MDALPLRKNPAVDESLPPKPQLRAFIQAARKRSYPPKHNIILSGDVPDTIFLVLEGSVTVFVDDADGRQLTLAYLGRGAFFGEMCSFAAQEERTAIVRTRSLTLVAEMGYEQFRDFIRAHPDLMFEIAGQMAARLRDTTKRLSDLKFVDTAGRVAATLMRLAEAPEARERPGGWATFRLQRLELARMVGCSREMAGRVLTRMQDDGLITCNGKFITLRRPR